MAERVDVVVLGLGVGGEEVANSLADEGLNVVGIESNLVGGECPYFGCIPTKMMVRADDMLAEGRRIPGFAGDSTVKPDWKPVARRIRDVATDNWDDRVAVERFEGKGGHFVRGAGKLAGPGKVSVIEGMDRVLAMEEPEASAVLGEVLQRDGIELFLNARAMSVEPRGEGVSVMLADGRAIIADQLLVATGRRANLVDIGLE